MQSSYYSSPYSRPQNRPCNHEEERTVLLFPSSLEYRQSQKLSHLNSCFSSSISICFPAWWIGSFPSEEMPPSWSQTTTTKYTTPLKEGKWETHRRTVSQSPLSRHFNFQAPPSRNTFLHQFCTLLLTLGMKNQLSKAPCQNMIH